jgi:hypothetical protein
MRDWEFLETAARRMGCEPFHRAEYEGRRVVFASPNGVDARAFEEVMSAAHAGRIVTRLIGSRVSGAMVYSPTAPWEFVPEPDRHGVN